MENMLPKEHKLFLMKYNTKRSASGNVVFFR